jgi:hypothetical protein
VACASIKGDTPKTGHAVAYFVEALCCKPEDHGFDSRRVRLIFQVT